MLARLTSRLARGVFILSLAFVGLVIPVPQVVDGVIGPKFALAQHGPSNKGGKPILVRPRPSFGGSSLRPRPTRPSFKPRPIRPRPSLGGSYTRPSPVKPRPLYPTTRPNYQNGQGVRPIEVRPSRPLPNRPGLRPLRPNKPYPQYPDFVDTPDTINDVDRPKPPSWRPPSHRPPHHRPPHNLWGNWLWWNGVGWYHRYSNYGTTIVIVHDLPSGCRKRVTRAGQRYYLCNNIYYRSKYLRGERVYQLVGAQPGVANVDQSLRLTRPYMSGERVLDLQRLLQRRGYNVGTPDGVFGRGTERALKRFQNDVGLIADGVAGTSTMRLLR